MTAVTGAALLVGWSVIQDRWGFLAAGSDPPAAVRDVRSLSIEAAKIRNVQGDARVAIVEFSDFQCPFCGQHARETLPAIRRSLVETGTARYIMFHYPLEAIHPLAVKAAEAAECAGRQGRFWDMHDRLFRNANALSPESLFGHAGEAGLDANQFEQCMAGQTLELIHGDQAEGRRIGVTSTPTFFLGRVRDDGAVELLKRMGGVTDIATFEAEVAALSKPR